jgi:2-polyprenyl-3-methyl-5-hydroxy-6-metoxy-1,4-benzoquinol methylase
MMRAVLATENVGDVLDYGAGTGTLTRYLFNAERFRSVSGVDIMPRPLDLPAPVGWIQGDLNDVTPMPAASFDLIVAAEVIEHLENPRAVAREWFRLLRTGGSLVLSTPNNESWRALFSLLIHGHFVAFRDTCYPAHITALVRTDLHRILSEAGFTAIAFAFTDHGGLPRLPRVTWQRLGGHLFRGLRYSDNVLVLARKPGERGEEFTKRNGIPGRHLS